MYNSFKIAASLASLFFIVVYSTTNLLFYSAAGISLFVLFGLKFFLDLGKTIEMRDLIISIALLQWIVGPLLKYYVADPEDIFYYMAVSEEDYISFVFPASLLFIVGLYFPGLYKRINSGYHLSRAQELLKKYPNLDLLLIIGGIAAAFIESYAPLSLRFFLFLVGGIRFIGLFFLLMNQRKYKWQIFGGVMFWLFLDAMRHAIFHELLLWMVFVFIVGAFLFRFKTKHKILFLVPIIVFIILVQTLKFYFRQEVGQYSGLLDRAGLFSTMLVEEIQSGEMISSENNIEAAIDRINQGWIIARIMRHTPDYEPYANGETIIEGIEASLVPRFLSPGKAKAGGRTYFERFTGRDIGENTSMGLSPLGEAYANFGVEGGAYFMFALGLFYNFILFIVLRMTNRFPSLILWLPLLFLQVVKAETDFVVVLNHLVKASIVISLLFFGIRKFLGLKI